MTRRKSKRKYIVAVFATQQVYGGPEEGGWWYEAGYPVQKQKVRGGYVTFYRRDKALAYAFMLNRLMEDTTARHRRGVRELTACVCVDQVEAFPRHRPYYC